jgi:hypothetical protein
MNTEKGLSLRQVVFPGKSLLRLLHLILFIRVYRWFEKGVPNSLVKIIVVTLSDCLHDEHHLLTGRKSTA